MPVKDETKEEADGKINEIDKQSNEKINEKNNKKNDKKTNEKINEDSIGETFAKDITKEDAVNETEPRKTEGATGRNERVINRAEAYGDSGNKKTTTVNPQENASENMQSVGVITLPWYEITVGKTAVVCTVALLLGGLLGFLLYRLVSGRAGAGKYRL